MEEATKPQLWTRDFVFATISRMFSAMMFMLLATTIATVCFDVYGSSVSEAGVVVGVFIFGTLVSRIFIGKYTEIVGRRRLLIVGHAILLLFSLLYFIPMDLGAFIMLRFLHGVSFGVATNTAQVVGTGYIPQERWGEGMGFFTLSVSISSAIGPFVGLGMLQISIEAMYASSAACSLLALLFALTLRIPPTKPADDGAAECDQEQAPEKAAEPRKGFRIQDYVELKAMPLSALLAVWAICYSGMHSFVNTYGTDLGIALWVPFFFGLHSAANIVTRMPIGKLYDRKGENIVVLPSLVCFIASLVLLALCSNPLMLMLSGALSGVGYGSLFFMAQSLALKGVPPQRMGMAVSTFFIFADTGAGLGPLLMGLVHPIAGFSGMYGIAAAISLVSLPVYLLINNRRKKHQG